MKNTYAQVGINKNNPTATLDIQSKSNSISTKAIEANDATNNEVFTVFDNGNLQFEGALMPNGNPGKKGEYLFSKGTGYAPEWKAIFPEQTKQIYDVFQGAYLGTTGTLNNSASTWIKVGPSTTNIINSSIGIWSTTNREFTVSKNGVYIISFSLEMYTGTNETPTQAFAKLTAGDEYEFFADVILGYSPGFATYYNTVAGEVVKKLNIGDKIYISGFNANQWRETQSSLQIKYVEL
ncbi:hypothetical protein OH806_14290 [Chryseobacterium sp. WLa1L2M3]|uniref:C1q domain-containing protein n=1 Tax=Chryseobacterium oryctis TaxID=2952618 RepID=A0ABT3HRM9_9FLAO|nr:hypothetical protein [Chryseobacterium oryctis]